MTAIISNDDVTAILGSQATAQTDLITSLVDVCSEHVMNYCGRRFAPVATSATAKTFRVRARATMISLAPWDFQPGPQVAVLVDPTGSALALVAETDFYVAPETNPYGIADRIMLQHPLWLSSVAATRVDVTALWGWPTIPSPVVQATAQWVKNILTGVSAYPQGAQMDQEQSTPEGLIPVASRQLLAPFKHIVAA